MIIWYSIFVFGTEQFLRGFYVWQLGHLFNQQGELVWLLFNISFSQSNPGSQNVAPDTLKVSLNLIRNVKMSDTKLYNWSFKPDQNNFIIQMLYQKKRWTYSLMFPVI